MSYRCTLTYERVSRQSESGIAGPECRRTYRGPPASQPTPRILCKLFTANTAAVEVLERVRTVAAVASLAAGIGCSSLALPRP